MIGGRKMKTIPVLAVRMLGVLVGLLLLTDLFRASFDWRIAASRLTMVLPMLIPWSLLKKRWSQAVVYFALWVDLVLSFGLVATYFAFVHALGSDAFPASVAIAAGAIFCVCAPSLLLMRGTFSRVSDADG